MLGGPEVVVFRSARAALSASIEAIAPESSVAVPAYTCVAVANAVSAAGCQIRWLDVDEAGRSAPTPIGDCVFIAQDTYGFPAWFPPPATAVVRDSSHRADLLFEWPRAAVTITSFEHSKWLTAGYGGIAATAERGLAERLREIRDRARSDGGAARDLAFTALSLLAGRLYYAGHERSGNRVTLLLHHLDRGRLDGQSSRELAGLGLDSKRLGIPDRATARLIYLQMRHVNEVAAHRSSMVAAYDDVLGVARKPLPLLRYPLIAHDRRTAEETFLRQGWHLGKAWFDTPLYPDGPATARYGLSAPAQAEHLSRRVINLPTHPLVTIQDAHELASIALAIDARPILDVNQDSQ